MIHAHFIRSLNYLVFLTTITVTGCTQQSTNHLSLANPAENNASIPPLSAADELLANATASEISSFSATADAPAEIKISSAIEATNSTANAEPSKEFSPIQTASEFTGNVLDELSQTPDIATLTRDNFIVKRAEQLNAAPAKAETKPTKRVEKLRPVKLGKVGKLPKNSLWGRLFAMYGIAEQENPRIEQEMDNLLKHPKSLIALQQRAEPYLYLILQELKANKLPGELALLPMIESAFKPDARSHAEAAGLWQFTPSTGLSFGLKQNWWYDGRLDVYTSTQAAARYLKQLNEIFKGDWLLALASYNYGLGNVQKAIRKNQEQALATDFWSLDLPQETRVYVPKLLAIAKLFAHADQYNLPLQPIANQPFFKAIKIETQLDLNKAAELAGMTLDEFFMLNPAFSHAVTAPDGPYHILVKPKNAANFKRKLAQLPKNELVKWAEHKVKQGEDLMLIAKLHDIPVETIMEINQLKNQKLSIGSVLKLPPTFNAAVKKV